MLLSVRRSGEGGHLCGQLGSSRLKDDEMLDQQVAVQERGHFQKQALLCLSACP